MVDQLNVNESIAEASGSGQNDAKGLNWQLILEANKSMSKVTFSFFLLQI